MYNIGDKVRVITYGHLRYHFEDGKYAVEDVSPELIGQEGIVVSKHEIQGIWSYALEGIKGKHAWYDERQLELVSKNNNYE